MAKLSDIAHEVGVSTKTVSMTLRGQKCASPDVTRRIIEVSDRLGYVPSQAARDMQSQQSNFIGFLANFVATTPHSVEIVRGAQAEATARGRHLMVGTTEDSLDAERRFLTMAKAHRVRGIIYATLYRRRLDRQLEVPVDNLVLVNCGFSGSSGHSIMPDDEGGGRMQASVLIGMGHTRIAVISLPMGANATAHRLRGIQSVMAVSNLQLNPEFRRSGVKGPPETEAYVAYEVAKELLSRPDRPTAIIAGNDRIAMLTFCAAADLGIRVPDDLSIIGFDDFQTLTEGMRPQLTSVRLPYYEMGKRAVSDILEGVSDEPSEVSLPCQLIDRQSCAPPKM